jgi:hypothetical protein
VSSNLFASRLPQPFQDFLFHRNLRASRSQAITTTGPWTSEMLLMGVFVVSGAAAGMSRMVLLDPGCEGAD